MMGYNSDTEKAMLTKSELGKLLASTETYRVAAGLINISDIEVSVSHTARQYWKTSAKESA